MSRSGLLRGAELSGETVALALRPPGPLEPESPEDLLARAHDEGAGVVHAAHAEAEAIRAAARAEGLAAARAEVEGALDALTGMVRALEDERARLADAAAAEATTLALEVAARLLRAEVSARPERVLDVLRGAVRRASERGRLVARVNPADLDVCRGGVSEIKERMGGILAFQVVDDPRVAAGSCVLETPNGDVDATFESQLARVLEALRAPVDESLLT